MPRKRPRPAARKCLAKRRDAAKKPNPKLPRPRLDDGRMLALAAAVLLRGDGE